MSDPPITTYGDPITAPFWAAASDKRLLVQRCRGCGQHQFYPRNFCLACQSSEVEWIAAKGTGVVYSMTVSHIQVLPELPPPYIVALIQLAEGPRLLSNVIGGNCRIGDPVRVSWRERPDAPPLPIFELNVTAR